MKALSLALLLGLTAIAQCDVLSYKTLLQTIETSESDAGFTFLMLRVSDEKSSRHAVYEYLNTPNLKTTKSSSEELVALTTAISMQWPPDKSVSMVSRSLARNRSFGPRNRNADERFVKTHCLNKLLEKDLSSSSKLLLGEIAVQGVVDHHAVLYKWYFKVLDRFGTVEQVEYLISKIREKGIAVECKASVVELCKKRFPELLKTLP